MIVTVLIFVAAIFVTICSTFIVGYNGLFIKRTAINIPFYLFEKTVISVKDNGNDLLVFNLDEVQKNVADYFDKTLIDRCTSYKFKLWPYKINDEGIAVFNDNFLRVEKFQLHFKGYYFKDEFIETYATYSIKEISVTDE